MADEIKWSQPPTLTRWYKVRRFSSEVQGVQKDEKGGVLQEAGKLG